MPKLKPDTIFPAPEEDAKITAGIASDPDDFELDDSWFERARPASEVFGEKFLQILRGLKNAKMVAEPEHNIPLESHPRG